MKTYVGYHITDSPQLGDIIGNASINGESCSHLLSVNVKHNLTIDVGRNEDAELVWVSTAVEGTPAVLPPRFIPEQTYQQIEIDLETPPQLPVYAHYETWIKKIKPLWIVAACASIGLCVFAYFAIPNGSAVHSVTQESSPLPTVLSQPILPEQAAIDFVLAGTVAGISSVGNLEENNLDARILSESGELVLVEVSSVNLEATTIVATLLLQKDNQTWRIRQVYN